VKLSNYFEKSVRVRPKRSQRIVVTNEHVKQKFDVQISHLETRNNELQDTIIKLQIHYMLVYLDQDLVDTIYI